MENIEKVYEMLSYKPASFELFRSVVEIFQMAPSMRLKEEAEIYDEAVEACDYLVTDGIWEDESSMGRTRITWDGQTLQLEEGDGEAFFFTKQYRLKEAKDLH